MFYLPRICEHCLNPSCVASCPSGAMYKREEDGIVLVDQAEVPRLALLRLRLPLQEGLLQPPHRQGREVHALLPADRGRPADDLLGDLRRAASATSASCSTTPTGSRRPPRCPTSATCSTPSATCSSTPRTRRSARRRARDGIPDDWIEAARRSPVYALAHPLRRGAAAAPRVPHAADGLVRAAALADRQLARDRRLRGRPRRRLPGDRHDADPARVPRQPAGGRRRRGDPRRAAPAGGDARPHAQARGPRRARRGAARRGRDDRRPSSRTCTGCWRSPSTRTAT